MDFSEKIAIIVSQTNYSVEIAAEKLNNFGGDHIKVIRDYMGIPEKKETVTSLNQEIYKQIRFKLDDSMKSYNSEQEAKIKSEIEELNNEKSEQLN